MHRVLGKSDAFLQWGDMALHCVYAVFVPVLIVMEKRYLRVLTKIGLILLHLIIINFVVSQWKLMTIHNE